MTENQILITGSEGLIGAAISKTLVKKGYEVKGLDRRAKKSIHRGDVRDIDFVRKSINGCRGVIHLAAVSRVVWGEQFPEVCKSTNVGGTQNILDAAIENVSKPWVIFSSSREVYGQPNYFPIDETEAINPINIYGKSKADAEYLVKEAKSLGIATSIVRLSNVYGSISDHEDRVVPAFTKAALLNKTIRIDGARNTFDFIHLDDVVNGLVLIVRKLEKNKKSMPTLQLLTGKPTTLADLAKTVIKVAGTNPQVIVAKSQNFNVTKFYGTYQRARKYLNWNPKISLLEGITKLSNEFRMAIH